MKYWDLENFQNISVTSVDSSEINHLDFYEENSDLLFAASNDHVRLWNVETNKQLDCLSLPPKTITDMKIAPNSGESGLLLVSAIQRETISIYFSHLKNINFDESIDMLPTNIGAQNAQSQAPTQAPAPKVHQSVKNNREDVPMQVSSPAVHQSQPTAELGRHDFDNNFDKHSNMRDDPDVSRHTTFVQAPQGNEPVGVDMSAFEKPMRAMNDDSEMAGGNTGPPQKSDTEIINECMQKHTTFQNVMQLRLDNNRSVMNYIIQNNDMAAALNALRMIKDATVTMDILNSTFAKNKRMDMLNFQKITQLMPFVQDMLDSKYETHNKAGLKTALNVLKAYQAQIIAMKQSSAMGGVDLAREDRIQKCDAVVEAFYEMSKSKSFQKTMSRGGEIKDVALDLNRTMQNFFNQTKG